MKINIKLPNTAMCVVVWYRNGEAHNTLMKTPPNNEALRSAMLGHKVGYSEIRAVKAVNAVDLTNVINRNTLRHPVMA